MVTGSAFEVLHGLVTQVPDALTPVITHVGNMLNMQADLLIAHVGDNDDTYAAIANVTGQLNDRMKSVEDSIVAVNATIVQIS